MNVLKLVLRRLGYVKLSDHGFMVGADGRLVPMPELADDAGFETWQPPVAPIAPLHAAVRPAAPPRSALPPLPRAPAPPVATAAVSSAEARSAFGSIEVTRTEVGPIVANEPPVVASEPPIEDAPTAAAESEGGDDDEWEWRMAMARARAKAELEAIAPAAVESEGDTATDVRPAPHLRLVPDAAVDLAVAEDTAVGHALGETPTSEVTDLAAPGGRRWPATTPIAVRGAATTVRGPTRGGARPTTSGDAARPSGLAGLRARAIEAGAAGDLGRAGPRPLARPTRTTTAARGVTSSLTRPSVLAPRIARGTESHPRTRTTTSPGIGPTAAGGFDESWTVPGTAAHDEVTRTDATALDAGATRIDRPIDRSLDR